MDKSEIKLILLIISICFLFGQCKPNYDLNKIMSTEPYFISNSKKLDTTNYYRTSNLSSNIDKGDTLTGKYNFIVWAHYHYHNLILQNDSTFIEQTSTDTGLHKIIKGKWTIRNNLLILKGKNGENFSFIFYKYSWTIFLIPTTKDKLFKIQFDRNKKRIDNLSNNLSNISQLELVDSLEYLTQLCFYRETNNK